MNGIASGISEQQFTWNEMAGALNAAAIAMWDWDIPGDRLRVNDAYTKMLGRDKTELQASTFSLFELLHPDERDQFLESITSLLEGGRDSSTAEQRLLHRDGRYIPVSTTLKVLARDESGRCTRMIGLQRDTGGSDLQTLKSAQINLDRERRLLRNMLDSSPVSFIIVRDSRVIFSTRHTKSLLGLEVGDPVTKCLLEDGRELAALARELAEKGAVNWRPLTLLTAEGGLSENLINAYNDEFEGHPATLCWIMDVTELRRNERALKVARDLAEESTRAKGDFLANISHEIRTPMNAVIGLTHLLLQSDIDEQQRNYLLKSDSAARSLLRLINDLLDFSKIEAGKLEIVPSEFHLADLLKKARDVVSAQLGEKGLEMVLAVDPNTPAGLVGDDLRLLQVLNNLTSNAVKFTERGEIRLSVEVVKEKESEAELRFLVRDTGIGLSRDQAAKLFSAFTQADTSHTRRYGGTGLGLTISKRLVEMMGGAIWCESVPGVGSTFGFTVCLGRHQKAGRYGDGRLPADGAAVEGSARIAAIKKNDPAEMVRHLAGARLLLVEDNDINQLVARKILKKAGFEVKTAANGQEAVEMVEAEPFDLVLMDIQMPLMDGLTATTLIRKNPKFAQLPIVAMTAHAMAADREKSLEVGMNAHICKPLDLPELFHCLADWLKAPQAETAEFEKLAG